MTKPFAIACTSSTRPRAPRGGKGADKRFAAYDAECARVAELYCGVSTYSIARVTACTTHTNAVGVFEGERCRGWHGVYDTSRHLVTEEQRQAVYTQLAS